MKGLDANTKAARRSKQKTKESWLTYLEIAALAVTLSSTARVSLALSAGEKTFASPGDAALALYTAAKAQDNQTLEAIFDRRTEDSCLSIPRPSS